MVGASLTAFDIQPFDFQVLRLPGHGPVIVLPDSVSRLRSIDPGDRNKRAGRPI
jgi:hypothetical protein